MSPMKIVTVTVSSGGSSKIFEVSDQDDVVVSGLFLENLVEEIEGRLDGGGELSRWLNRKAESSTVRA